MYYGRIFILMMAGFLVFSEPILPRTRSKTRNTPFVATAHSVEGTTANGDVAQTGTVAADPEVLPLGSRIRVEGAGRYSGEYTVTDTGAKVKGRKIDMYMPSNSEAKNFGKRKVKVRVLHKGEGK